ncbi:MAG: patatin-like phospholipase family protein [Alphaproteobacteria bacterium]
MSYGWEARADPPPADAHAEPPGFHNIRFVGDDSDLTRFLGAPPALAVATRPGPIRVLALSGGGAGGAFGAGALVGLTEGSSRPVFDTVTGVSAGALIAPFAFVGSEWDARLKEAFTGTAASELLSLTSVRPGPSLYPREQLANLVGRYIDAALMVAVADAHDRGRRLFVATANLDAQNTSIWDMGAIASSGRSNAQDLFIDILVASASVPGVFPPKMISVEAGGERFEEMHVDGGAITPLFVVPEALLSRKDPAWEGSGVEIYALVNTPLAPTLRATPARTVPILVRSFQLMVLSSYRNALRSLAQFCEINDFNLQIGSVPTALSGSSMLRFDRSAMTEMFAHGLALGRAGKLWSPYSD